MSVLTGLLVGVGVLLWPGRFSHSHGLAILPRTLPKTLNKTPNDAASGAVLVPASVLRSAWERARRALRGGRAAGVSAPALLGLLEAIAPALEAGMTPASALRNAADARAEPGRVEPLVAMARGMASAAVDGASLAPLWRAAAQSAASAELLLLSQAWSLTEDLGVPLAQAVRTTAGLLEARIAHERQLAGAVAGAKATVNVLTVLPLGGPLLGMVLGIGPAELYGGSLLTKASLMLGLALALVGRWWVRTMVRAVARGPVMA